MSFSPSCRLADPAFLWNLFHCGCEGVICLYIDEKVRAHAAKYLESLLHTSLLMLFFPSSILLRAVGLIPRALESLYADSPRGSSPFFFQIVSKCSCINSVFVIHDFLFCFRQFHVSCALPIVIEVKSSANFSFSFSAISPFIVIPPAKSSQRFFMS